LYNVRVMKIEALNLNGIKRETARRLISALLSEGPMTRTRLAELCGVSAMTAGKAVKELLESSVIRKEWDTAELFYPSELLTVLTLKLCEDKFLYSLSDLSGNTLAADRITRNRIYTYEEDSERFLLAVRERISAAIEDRYCIGAVVADTPKQGFSALAERVIGFGFAEPVTEISAVSKLSEMRYPSETVLLVTIGDHTDYRLIVGGIPTSPAHSAHREITELDEVEIIRRIVRRIIELSSVTLPTRVLVTSDRMRIDKKLIAALCEELKRRSVSIADCIVEIRGNTDSSFEAEWAVETAALRYAELFSGETEEKR